MAAALVFAWFARSSRGWHESRQKGWLPSAVGPGDEFQISTATSGEVDFQLTQAIAPNWRAAAAAAAAAAAVASTAAAASAAAAAAASVARDLCVPVPVQM